MVGATIKEKFGPKGDILDDVFYPIDAEGNIDWNTINRIRDNPHIPTYDDMLKELDISRSRIILYKEFGPSYSSLLHIYALKRGLNFSELLGNIQAGPSKEEEIESGPEKEE